MSKLADETLEPDSHTVWLTPQILTWYASQAGASPILSPLTQLSHDEWDHAAILLNPPCSCCQDRDVDRKDATLAIWRAVERRVRLLSEEYSLNRIPGATEKVPRAKKLGDMEAQIRLLEELGLVRGPVLSTIRQLRNTMMHGPRANADSSTSESAPEKVPDREKCLIYHDMVWYFLRSTEHLARRQVTSYYLSDDPLGNPDSITIGLDPSEWTAVITDSNIRADLISYDERNLWIPVFVDSVGRPRESYKYGYCYPHPGKDLVRLEGCVDTRWILEFAKKSFTAV